MKKKTLVAYSGSASYPNVLAIIMEAVCSRAKHRSGNTPTANPAKRLRDFHYSRGDYAASVTLLPKCQRSKERK